MTDDDIETPAGRIPLSRGLEASIAEDGTISIEVDEDELLARVEDEEREWLSMRDELKSMGFPDLGDDDEEAKKSALRVEKARKLFGKT